MTDPITTLRALFEKAEAKVEKASKALETAKTELSDYATALRVMQGLAGESPSLARTATAQGSKSLASQLSKAVGNRQSVILALLPHTENASTAPFDLYELYRATGDDINLDTFRTTIWRMSADGNEHRDSEGLIWQVFRANGRYWKERKTEPLADLLS